jgi:hypothetical protein
MGAYLMAFSSMTNKTCLCCEHSLTLEAFGTDRTREDGKNVYCKSCINKRVGQRRHAWRERFYFRRESNAKPTAKLIPRNKARATEIFDAKMAEGPTTFDDLYTAIRQGYRRDYSEDSLSELIAERLLERREIISYTVGDVRYYELRRAA